MVDYVEMLIAELRYGVIDNMLSEARANMYMLYPEELRFNPYHDPSNGRFTSGGGSGSGVDKSGGSGIIKAEKKVYSFEEYAEKPILLGETTAEEKHDYYKLNSYDISPLSKGNFKGIDFKDGGGYIVRYSDKQSILMYHPPRRTHHGNAAYYKLSSGKIGVRRYNMDGTPRKD